MATTDHSAFDSAAGVQAKEPFLAAAAPIFCTENVLFAGALHVTWEAMGYPTADFQTYTFCALAGVCVLCGTYLKALRIKQSSGNE